MSNTDHLPRAVRDALEIHSFSSAQARTIDITTTGRTSGQPHRIEIWFYRAHGTIYLSSVPARRGWYANLLANPEFTFHLKHGIHADLRARARPVIDPEERRHIMAVFIDDLNQKSNPARLTQKQNLDDWVAGSPLMEVTFLPSERSGRSA